MKHIELADGTTIVDQMCHCGHVGSLHDKQTVATTPFLVEQPEHGPCTQAGCTCMQFTWKEFVIRK